MFPGNSLLPFFHIKELGFTVDLFEFIGLRVNMSSDHLFGYGSSVQINDAYVVSGGRFNSDNIPNGQLQSRGVAEISFMGIFETDLVDIGIFTGGKTFKPVESSQFATTVYHLALEVSLRNPFYGTAPGTVPL